MKVNIPAWQAQAIEDMRGLFGNLLGSSLRSTVHTALRRLLFDHLHLFGLKGRLFAATYNGSFAPPPEDLTLEEVLAKALKETRKVQREVGALTPAVSVQVDDGLDGVIRWLVDLIPGLSVDGLARIAVTDYIHAALGLPRASDLDGLDADDEVPLATMELFVAKLQARLAAERGPSGAAGLAS